MADAAHTTAHGAEAHGHAHPAHLAHHFDTSEQQFNAGKLGMWLFLATEVLMFGGLFCAYSVYRAIHPEIFLAGHEHLSKYWGAFNTVVLLLSSFTMAAGVTFAQRSMRIPLIICLSLTLLGGAGFMVVKFVEYKAKIDHGLLWGFHYQPHEGHAAADAHAAEPAAAHGAAPAAAPDAAHAAPASGPAAPPAPGVAPPPDRWTGAVAGKAPAGLARLRAEAEHVKAKNVQIFFGIYFAMTGLHGLHVLVGMGIIAWLLVKAVQGTFSAEYFTPVDLGGLYWHLVDLIWIFLFPLLYLIH